MALDWRNTSRTGTPARLNDLIARKKYAKAVELLRAELEGRMSPPPHLRLQLADMLILAGRATEAIPILIGLADEYTTDGFVARAIAILKRVDRIETGRADVETRLVSLVRSQTTASGPPSRSKRIEIGAEELETAPEATAREIPAPPEALPTEELSQEPPPGTQDGVVERIRGAFRRLFPGDQEPPDDATRAPPSTEAAVEPPLDAVAETPPTVPETTEGSSPRTDVDVTDRIRGAVRRFLSSVSSDQAASVECPPSETKDGTLVPIPEEPEPEIILTSEPISEVEPIVEPEAIEILEEPANAPDVPATEVKPEPVEVLVDLPEKQSLEAPVEIRTDQILIDLPVNAAVDEPAAEISEDHFHERVLDVVEEALQPPPLSAPPPRPPVVEIASRLLAVPLFADFGEEELLGVVRDLTLRTAEPGDIVVSEGERSEDLYILTSGVVKIFVRSPDGRNFGVGRIQEGEFFGELSTLSGRRRSATVTVAERAELLVLAKPALDALARAHPRLRETLENSYVRRASDPDAAAVRAVPLGETGSEARAIEILEAHFGESRWDPRMRLRLADLLIKAGKEDDAVPILVGLADELAREGFPEKAIAVLKKVERIRQRHVEEVVLAPLKKAAVDGSVPLPAPSTVPIATPTKGKRSARTEAFFDQWLLDMVRDAARRRVTDRPDRDLSEQKGVGEVAPLDTFSRSLRSSPLFTGLSEEEILAMIRGLRLLSFEPGDVILTEGEPGKNIFILAAGTVRVFVRGPDGRDVPILDLKEGDFFGEIAALSGRRRSATVVSASDCDLLVLDALALEEISRDHPRLRAVLEEHLIERAASPKASEIRGRGRTPTD